MDVVEGPAQPHTQKPRSPPPGCLRDPACVNNDLTCQVSWEEKCFEEGGGFNACAHVANKQQFLSVNIHNKQLDARAKDRPVFYNFATKDEPHFGGIRRQSGSAGGSRRGFGAVSRLV